MSENEIIPMTSVRLGPGAYEVLGTSRGVRVIQDSAVRGGGWALIVDGERYGTYFTKRAALQAAQKDVTL